MHPLTPENIAYIRDQNQWPASLIPLLPPSLQQRKRRATDEMFPSSESDDDDDDILAQLGESSEVDENVLIDGERECK